MAEIKIQSLAGALAELLKFKQKSELRNSRHGWNIERELSLSALRKFFRSIDFDRQMTQEELIRELQKEALAQDYMNGNISLVQFEKEAKELDRVPDPESLLPDSEMIVAQSFDRYSTVYGESNDDKPIDLNAALRRAHGLRPNK